MKLKIRNKFTKEERRMIFVYREFIESDWWEKQKTDWYSRHKKRCARCKSEKVVQLHHKRYPKNGRYLSLTDNSFVALCVSCHHSYHKEFGVKQYMQTTSNRFIKELGKAGKSQECIKSCDLTIKEVINQIINGDCLEKLKDLESESVDLIVTDPPYGYSFMGKDWDKAVPSVDIWKECLRVLKPGAFAFVMSAPRQDVLSQMIVRVTEAGFDTNYTSLYWTYASGFPKAMNIGKAVDKRLGFERERIAGGAGTEGNTFPLKPEAISLNGSYGGFQPKPAVEVIIVAMKPLSEKTFVDQALKNRKGITWLCDARIPTTNFDLDIIKKKNGNGIKSNGGFAGEDGDVRNNTPDTGRFPANLLVSDDVLNDRQVRKAGKNKLKKGMGGIWNKGTNLPIGPEYGDAGSYSRYFDLDAWAKTLPFLICPKASKSEKNKGLDDFEEVIVNDGRVKDIDNAFQRETTKRQNSHPTVKPLKLMSYLITLGSREGDVVLDPFAGSCTTCVAAQELKRKYIGIERESEYVKICEARLAVNQPTLL